MGNSPLVSYVKLSPNHGGRRKHAIDMITPHCVVGQCSVETLGEVFEPESRKASSNYGIGVDGRVGMFVPEDFHSWCSSNWKNDDRAVTIECASDNFHPYALKPLVYERLIDLCVDICKRNGKKKLLWLGDKERTLAYAPAPDEMLLSAHRWYANKTCPGDWLYSRYGELAEEVTKRLNGKAPEEKPPERPAEKQDGAQVFYRVFAEGGQVGAYRLVYKAEAHAKRLNAWSVKTRIEKIVKE